MKIAIAQINPIIGAFEYNRTKIIDHIKRARHSGADLIVFPEMAVCGYPPEDLLLLPSFIAALTESLKKIIDASEAIIVVLGCVRENISVGEKRLFNSAALIQDRELIGFQDKVLLPDYDVFSERRYFEPGGNIKLWNIKGKNIALTICEDIWQHSHAIEYSNYPRDPIVEIKPQIPDLLINLSASPYYLRRHEIRLQVCRAAVTTLNCPLIYCNQVGGNDSLIFDGYSLYMGADGTILHYAKGFKEDLLMIDTEQQGPPKNLQSDMAEDLFNALVLGVHDYFHKLRFSKACFGLSGGIDSAVLAVIAAEALGKENILAMVLPSRYTTDQSFTDARKLTEHLHIRLEEISIERPFNAFLDILATYFRDKAPDVTEENLQARIRGILLMAFSNKFGYLLLSPGNKSELAMGYATLYGDMCGGLGVLSDVTKEQVYILARWINKEREIIPTSILSKPPSAELKPNQKDTDSLPEYSIVDCVLQEYVENHRSPDEIAASHKIQIEIVKELVRKIHLNEYKRRQAPPGLRVTKKAFTVGRRFPIVQHFNLM